MKMMSQDEGTVTMGHQEEYNNNNPQPAEGNQSG
jgi:hypothetical protein